MARIKLKRNANPSFAKSNSTVTINKGEPFFDTTTKKLYVGTSDGQQIKDAETVTVDNAVSATKLSTARKIALTGDVTGEVNFDGSSDTSITTEVADNSHNHTMANVTGLQTSLNDKATSAQGAKADTAVQTITIGGTVQTKTSGTVALPAYPTSVANATNLSGSISGIPLSSIFQEDESVLTPVVHNAGVSQYATNAYKATIATTVTDNIKINSSNVPISTIFETTGYAKNATNAANATNATNATTAGLSDKIKIGSAYYTVSYINNTLTFTQ